MILWKAGENPIVIAMRTILILTCLLFGIQARPCGAQYGWPPPGYDLRTWTNCNGCHYRRLCEIIHDHRCRCCCQCRAKNTCPANPANLPSLPRAVQTNSPQSGNSHPR
jgi:hypothetical protein